MPLQTISSQEPNELLPVQHCVGEQRIHRQTHTERNCLSLIHRTWFLPPMHTNSIYLKKHDDVGQPSSRFPHEPTPILRLPLILRAQERMKLCFFQLSYQDPSHKFLKPSISLIWILPQA